MVAVHQISISGFGYTSQATGCSRHDGARRGPSATHARKLAASGEFPMKEDPPGAVRRAPAPPPAAPAAPAPLCRGSPAPPRRRKEGGAPPEPAAGADTCAAARPAHYGDVLALAVPKGGCAWVSQ
eukprot:gene12660-biopygen9472